MKKIAYLLMLYTILLPADNNRLFQQPSVEQLIAHGKQLSDRCLYNQAQPFFEQACILEPHNLKHRLELWKVYIQQEQLDKALELLKNVTIDNNQDFFDYLGYYWACGITYNRLQKIKLAQFFFHKIINSKPIDHYRYWWLVGNAYSALEQPEEAITCWERTLELVEPNEDQQSFVKIYRNMGHTYIKLGLYEKAISILEKAVTLNPYMASSYDSLGTAYRKQGNIEKALEQYHHALAIDPTWANSINNIGICYYKDNKQENAYQQFQKALALRPHHPEAHFRLGKYYVYKTDKEQALSHLQQASVAIKGQDMILTQHKVEKYINKAELL